MTALQAEDGSRGGLIRALREGGWIVGHRVRPYAIGAICAYLAWATIGVIKGYWLYQSDGTPVPADFIAYWSAVRMAMQGQAALAYDWAAHHAVQVAAIGQEFQGFFAWHNPPHFLLLLLPFAPLPYVPAWLLFNLVTALLFLAVFARVLPVRGAWIVALGAPASFLCVIAGQLGFLIAALTGACLLLLDRRPVPAGLMLGLLTIKPQYGLLFPLLLAATGRWRVFVAAGVSTILLALASALLFGTESWVAFHHSLTGETLNVLRRGGSDWNKLQSLYAVSYMLGVPERWAIWTHAAGAMAIAALVTWLWRRPGTGEGVRAAAAIAGNFLMTPYAYVYDAVTVVLAAGFLAREMVRHGALPWERLLLCLAVAAPATFFVTGSLATPLAMLTLLALAIRRALAEVRRPAV